MKRLLLIAAGVIAAGGVAAAPAVAGLTDNPSFSRQIPIRVPSQVQAPQLVDDHGEHARLAPTSTRTPTSAHTVEPGDDRGGSTRHVEPGDDRGGATRHVEPGDDRGATTEPGDDRGGSGSGSGGGGSGGSGRGGSDDGGSHG
ncbi:MAG: hypothetical protein QOC66_3050 [Pseudonocardiales bacterium]|nr:hypothetical protein [Pseudonocardiales bacterium]